MFEPVWKPTVDSARLQELQLKNDFANIEVGHFTGRCGCCGSSSIWDDNLAYGCNECGALLATNDVLPRLVRSKQE